MYRFILFFLPIVFAACSGNSAGADESPISEDFSNSSGGNHGTSGTNPGDATAPEIPIIPDETVVEDSTVVNDAGALPSCTAVNEGESFMVAAENAVYFCMGGTWRKDVVETIGVSCRDGVLSAGAEIAVDVPSTFGIDSTGTLVLRREGVAVAGVAEKGPFRYGTSVIVVELDSLMRLADSDRRHVACITANDGRYSFKALDLVSPYVRVEASGYYKNELTGGLSADLVTLTAVTDLTERDSVNVNMLTHLESFRTLKMIENTGNNQPIRTAKEQALKDVLYSFDMVVPGFNDPAVPSTIHKISDEVSLFDGNDFSAALIALSIMMQRRGSGDNMLTYAYGVADRIRGNGNWDDWAARADLADWLMVLDTSGSYGTIRKNLEALKLGPVADFEKYLRNFWTKAYQFPVCESQTAGMVTHIGQSQSAFFACNYTDPNAPKVRFICDSETHVWRTASDVEKDTVGLGADTSKYDGAFRAGVVNVEKSYIYEASKNAWRPVTSNDVMEFSTIDEVYGNLAADEKVVFVLRHAERTDDTGKNGPLTEGGKAQAQNVGRKLEAAGPFYLGYSGYVRTRETCENIALGAGQHSVFPEIIEGLDGDWFVKDQNAYGNAKAMGGGSLSAITRYAYRGLYSDAFYDLEERSQEFVSKFILNNRSKLERVNFYISHDMMVLPFAVYASQKKVNLRYFDNRSWLNYLAGVAVIVNGAGTVRYAIVRGLDSGTMII